MNHDFETLIRALSAVLGSPLVVKVPGDLLKEQLADEHTMHCNAFCLKVKSAKSRLALCMRDDCGILHRTGQATDGSFLRVCHAGATELALPLSGSGRYLAAVLYGVFRIPDKACPYFSCRTEYDALPAMDMRTMEAAKIVLEQLADTFSEGLMKRLRKPGGQPSVQDSRIAKAQEYLETNLAQAPAAADLAELCGFSVSRFLHLFSEETGRSFSLYLRDLRLRMATHYLTRSGLTIGEIAEICGFRRLSYFGSFFRKETGMTPGAYRKQNAVPLTP